MNGLEKLLSDPDFMRWVKEPDAESDARWKNWQEKNPDKIGEFNEVVALAKSLYFKEYPVSEGDKKDDWKKIKAGTQMARQRVAWGFSKNFYRVAAVILLLLTASVTINIVNRSQWIQQEKPVSHIQKETMPGQKLSVRLSDGTVIKLNSDSRLTYPPKFSKGSRIVTLNGEGYFEVAKNPQEPFIVRCGNVTTRVLGTTFNVNGYDKSNVKVSLVEGSVEVSAEMNGEKDEKLLIPGEKALWSNNKFTIKKIDTLRDIGWKDNILVFEGNNIREIKNILERWYGVTVVIKDADRLSGTFNGEFQSENLSNVLKSIGFAMSFEYRINDKNVCIKPLKNEK